MSWPLSQDYNEAIQSPRSNFTDADLQRGEAVANALGLPMPYSGNFADVYQVRCPDGKSWAVKCFTREAPGLRERYQEISAHLRQARLPFSVDFSYLEKGIRVAGKWHPVLKMHWVEGLTLNQFVAQYLDKPAMLEALLQLWARMGKYLRAADVGHCDLQHGNVLLVPGATPNSLSLKLIDYDGMWVPSLAGKNSGEVGHANYQHPRRLREGTFSLEVDRFPLLLVATAMRALKADKRLWSKYDNGDNMLFKESDLAAPGRSELFEELSSLPDPGLVMLAAQVRAALKGGLESAALLEEAMPDAKGAPTTAPARRSKPGEGPPSGAGLNKSGPRVAPVVVAPVVVPPPKAEKTFAFDEGAPERAASAPSRARLKKLNTKAKSGGVPIAVWAGAAAAAVLVLAGAVGAFFMTRGGGDKPPAGQPVAQNQPAGPGTANTVKGPPPPAGQQNGNVPPPPVVEPPNIKTPESAPAHELVNSLGMKLVLIPAGKFTMGSPNNEDARDDNEGPQHEVEITRAFYMGAYPVTRGQFAAFVKDEGYQTVAEKAGETNTWRNPHFGNNIQTDNHPVVHIAWDDATAFCAWLSKKEGKTYELPTEAEREYACRAGTTTAFSFQNPNELGDYGWYVDNSGGHTHPVGEKKPNPWGLYDMHGNVWQWCADGYERYREGPVKDPVIKDSANGRILRGGSWYLGARGCRSAYRGNNPPVNHNDNFGFRVVLRSTTVAEPTVAKPGTDPDARGSISEVRRFEGHTEMIRRLALSPDGKQLLTAGFDNTLRLWDVATGRELLKVVGQTGLKMHGVAFLPDGKRALSCNIEDKIVHLWDLTDGHEIRSYSGHTDHVVSVAVSRDGRLAASCGADGAAIIWDVEAGAELHRLEGKAGGLQTVAFSPDAKFLLTGADRGAIRLWDVETGKELRRIGSHASLVMGLAFSPDGKLAVSSSFDKTACIWRVDDGREVRRFAGFTSAVWYAVFSPDGQRVLTGDDGTMRLWDAETGKELYRLEMPNGAWALAFSPDGRNAFSAEREGKAAHMWRLPPADYVPPPTPDTAPVAKKPEPKPAAPDEAAVAAADKEIKELYKAEYAKKKREDLLALADKLRGQGVETKDKPASRYALFRASRDLAAKVGDFALARRAAGEMADFFAVDAWEMNAQAVEAAARAAASPPAQVRVAEAALPLAEEAIDGDDYERADRLAKVAGAAVHSAGNVPLENICRERENEIDRLRKAWEPAGAALRTLAGKPDDPEANLAAGAYLCLDKGDWGRGLPLLALGSDKTLRAIAQADLDAVSDPAAQIELAKTYAGQADAEAGPRKAEFLRRACYWYQKAAAQLTGLSRTEVEKKIAEAEKGVPAIRPAVVCAYYGTYNDWPEVTDRVRTLLFQAKGQKLAVKADAGELGIPNHDNHQGKTLVIVYQVGGQTCLSITPEGATAVIPAPPGAADVDAARPGPGQDLLVLAARFGVEGIWLDVTLGAQHLVKGSSLTTPLGGLIPIDPAVGKHKTLLVVYRNGNRVRFSLTPDDQAVVIGTVPAKP